MAFRKKDRTSLYAGRKKRDKVEPNATRTAIETRSKFVKEMSEFSIESHTEFLKLSKEFRDAQMGSFAPFELYLGLFESFGGLNGEVYLMQPCRTSFRTRGSS